MTQPKVPRSWILLCTASGALIYSGYCLLDAILQAQSIGLVEVFPRGRRGPGERVLWPHAWAYLLGLVALVLGSATWVLLELRKLKSELVTISAFALGLPLVLLSGWFVSLASVAPLVGLAIAIALTTVVNDKLGRSAGLWTWAALVLAAFAIAS